MHSLLNKNQLGLTFYDFLYIHQLSPNPPLPKSLCVRLTATPSMHDTLFPSLASLFVRTLDPLQLPFALFSIGLYSLLCSPLGYVLHWVMFLSQSTTLIVKGKLHSKIIISDLVGFLFVEFDDAGPNAGQNSNRNTVKQTANRRPKLAKKYRVTTARPALHHWCQASKSRGCRMVLNSTGHDRFTMAGYEVIPADREHLESFAWPCMMAKWHQWCHKRLHMRFFSLSVWLSV